MKLILNQLLSYVALCFLTLTLAGCGGNADGPKLVTVSGNITLNGEPLPEGDVIFRAADGKGHAYAGKIKDGSYSIETEVGTKKVEIKSMKEVPGKTTEDNPGEVVNAREQVVPAKYNSESTLEFTVTEAGSDSADFALEGDPPKPKS
ncbi:hypothetical protein [Gimesia fumaroli]|uniref:Carboxypeptidase regulatory-like domain-containing protein n=1 Tax=Gimesia fumaroli TaxID=2527976 RepID=A0A518IKI3_9PLAN|nr:hypothetical protein [Gimesia fumaroli]QDV53607.1 hypothetical protein Enr17x_56870 [Gimesia fumaroli]